MATYDQLRDRALNQVGALGNTEAQTIAQTALEEAMKYVAFNVRIPSLISLATATAPASPELEANAIALTGGAGTFGITVGVFQCIDRIYVKKDTSSVSPGTPYGVLEYHHFLDLKSVPNGARSSLFEPGTSDERPEFCGTITPSDKLWLAPISENNVVSLYYRKNPAAYSGAGTPEILVMFDHIIVNGAVLALKEWQREPSAIINLWDMFEKGLGEQTNRYISFLNGQRKRTNLKIHRSYRPMRQY